MKKKCRKCKHEFNLEKKDIELDVIDNERIDITIICPHCGEDSEFLIIDDDYEFLECDY